jgi:CRISPR-associated protein Csx17
MTTHVHRLGGCSPTPLASYLKALGVLRSVASGLDPTCRGGWRDGAFQLVTTLSEDALLDFFATTWQPTPIATPWNMDGGFISRRGKAPEALEEASPLASHGPRFARYLEGLGDAARLVEGRAESPKDEEKLAVFRAARETWQDDALEWLDAVVARVPEEERPRYPALLASGGCDGRLDFGKTFRARLLTLFGASKSPVDARGWLHASLFGGPTSGLPGEGAGQFDPASTSPVNGGHGFRGESAVNPWDYVLAFEGIPLLRVTVARRLRSGLPAAAAPFAVSATTAGYGTAVDKDATPRGEQWLPLWSRPASLPELRGLFSEGRLMLNARPATTALEAARAVARLGVVRGLDAFERYGFVPRNGQSTLAVPLGRWQVSPNPRVRLLDALDAWLDRLRQAAGSAGAPLSLGRDLRRLEGALLEVCRDGSAPRRWQALLAELGALESRLATRPRFVADRHLQPVPLLPAPWAAAADDGSTEHRLALALALSGLPQAHRAALSDVLGPLRMHAIPLAGPSWTRFDTGESGLIRSPSLVWSGRELIADLTAVVTRRTLEADRHGAPGFPLDGPLGVSFADLEAFLGGAVDEVRLSQLARGYMLLDAAQLAREGTDATLQPARDARPLPLYALMRLTHLPAPLEALPARTDASLVRLLSAGRLEAAVALAIRRLRAAGLTPRLRFALGSPALARRLAASLAFPLSRRDLGALVPLLTKPMAEDEDPRPSL